MSILSKYSIYNIQPFIWKYPVSDLSLYEPSSKNILKQHSFLFLLTTDWMNIITSWKVKIFSVGKELYKLILILAKLWLMLSVIPVFYLQDI